MFCAESVFAIFVLLLLFHSEQEARLLLRQLALRYYRLTLTVTLNMTRKFHLTNRVVNIWNSVPSLCVS